jgi:cell division septal protein FtsQ
MLSRQKNRRISSQSSLRNPEKSGSFLAKLFFLMFIVGFVYLIFFSEFFLVTSVRVENRNDENNILASRIVQVLSDVRGENILFLNLSSLEERLFVNFPDFEGVKIYKSFPKTLKVEFRKFPDMANIIHEDATMRNVYIVNSKGVAVRSDEEKANLPFIKLDRDEPINLDEALIESSKLEYILELSKFFEDKFGMRVKETIYKPYAREVHLLTERNFYIWIDIQKDFESQLRKLKKAGPSLDIYNENFEYIDLRIAGTVGDRIIYKRRR